MRYKLPPKSISLVPLNPKNKQTNLHNYKTNPKAKWFVVLVGSDEWPSESATMRVRIIDIVLLMVF